jgi:hypothetical protein
VIEGRLGADGLAAVLEGSRAALEEMRAGFNRVVSAQTPEVLEAARVPVRSIDADFEGYRGLLDEIETYLAGFDLAVLAAALPRLEALVSAMDEDFFAFRQAALAAQGPTRVPGINLLVHLASEVLAGDRGPEALLEQVRNEEALTGAAAAQMKAGGEATSVLRAQVAYLNILKKLSRGAGSADGEALRGLVDELVKVGALFTAPEPTEVQRGLSEGPTSYPNVNAVVNLARQAGEGRVPRGRLDEAVKALGGQLQSLRANLGVMSRTSTSGAVDDAIAGIEPRLRALEDALASLREEALIGAAGALEAGLAELAARIEREGQVPCVKCGAFNPAGLRTCGRCNSVLPASVSEGFSSFEVQEGEAPVIADEQASDTVMTENVDRLFRAVNEFAEGESSRDELEAALAWMEGLLAEASRAGASPSRDENAQLYREGLEEFAVGLGLIRQAATDENREGLQAGQQIIGQGLGRLQKVQRAVGTAP